VAGLIDRPTPCFIYWLRWCCTYTNIQSI